MNITARSQTLKADIMAIDHKISEVDEAINKAKNVIRFATVCAKTTKDEQSKARFLFELSKAQEELKQQEKQKAVFQKGYEVILNKY